MNTSFAIWTALPLLVLGALVFFFLPREKQVIPSRTIHITAFGDSLTEGYGVEAKDAYPSILQARLEEEGYTVVVTNAGVSGETSGEGLLRAPSIRDASPDLVLLELGINDALRGISPSEIEENLRAILTLFREVKIPVVLLGMKSPLNAGLGYAQEFNALYPRLSEEYTLVLSPFFLKGVALRPELNMDDGLHPNKDGYLIIVEENILPMILPLMKTLSRATVS